MGAPHLGHTGAPSTADFYLECSKTFLSYVFSKTTFFLKISQPLRYLSRQHLLHSFAQHQIDFLLMLFIVFSENSKHQSIETRNINPSRTPTIRNIDSSFLETSISRNIDFSILRPFDSFPSRNTL